MQVIDSSIDDENINGCTVPHEISFLVIVKEAWKFRWLGLIFVLICLSIAVVYLRGASYKYTSELIVTSADQGGSRLPASLLSLGSIAGIDLSDQQGSAFSMYAEGVKSFPVAERLSRNPRIMHTIFSNEWDERASRWHKPQSAIRPIIVGIKRILGVPDKPWKAPSAIDLRQFIVNAVGVEEDADKSLIRLSFKHEDPKFAEFFIKEVNRNTDAFLREKALRRTSAYINYLERRLQQVQVAEYRQSLSQALSSYEKTRMMASSDASFAAEIFGDVIVSGGPTSPKPILVLFLSILIGVIFWSLYVIASIILKSSRYKRLNNVGTVG